MKNLRRLACKFDLDQSERKSSQVNASARKPWPNGVASRRKLKTWVYLRLRLARALRACSFGKFRNKNIFRNIFRLFCSWEQNSRNGIQVFRNKNSSQTNAYSHYSNYSYSGFIPNERALRTLVMTEILSK